MPSSFHHIAVRWGTDSMGNATLPRCLVAQLLSKAHGESVMLWGVLVQDTHVRRRTQMQWKSGCSGHRYKWKVHPCVAADYSWYLLCSQHCSSIQPKFLCCLLTDCFELERGWREKIKVVMINPYLIALCDTLFLPVDADSCIKLTAGLTVVPG